MKSVFLKLLLLFVLCLLVLPSGIAHADTTTSVHIVKYASDGTTVYPHISHGEALAVIYPAILRYSYRAAPAKFATVGRIMDRKLAAETGRKAAEMSCAAIERFIRRIGLDRKLRELHVPEVELAALALQSLVLPDYRNHPRVATLKDVSRILGESH